MPLPTPIGLVLIAFTAITISSPSAAQETCLDNSYVSNVPPGKIAVTDQALMYAYSNCPTSQLRLNQRIRLRAGQPLFLWFRVQGDRDYLATDQSRYPFVLSFYRENGSVAVDAGVISMKTLDRAAVIGETTQTGGVFDWRLGAKKWQFDIPGDYQIHLSQQGTDLDCLGSNVFRDCTVFVEVVP